MLSRTKLNRVNSFQYNHKPRQLNEGLTPATSVKISIGQCEASISSSEASVSSSEASVSSSEVSLSSSDVSLSPSDFSARPSELSISTGNVSAGAGNVCAAYRKVCVACVMITAALRGTSSTVYAAMELPHLLLKWPLIQGVPLNYF